MRIVEEDVAESRLCMEMPLIERLERHAGTGQFHGGAIGALIDTAAVFALMMVLKKPVPTINLRTDYIRPAMNTTLRAEALVRRVGRTIAVADVNIYNDDKALIAVGRGTFGA